MPSRPEKSPDSININLNINRISRNIFIFCFTAALGFVLLDLFVNYYELTRFKIIHRFCNIAREDSFASWFGTTQTFMVALTLWLLFFLLNHAQQPRLKVWGWFLIAGLFTYIAVDDGIELHERLGSVFEIAFKPRPYLGLPLSWPSKLLQYFPSYPWQVLFAPFFGVMGLFAFIFLWREFRLNHVKLLLILAMACFVIAVGLDFIEGLNKYHKWNIHTMILERYELREYTVRHFSKSLEEFLEMSGITLFWTAFIQYFKFLPKNNIRFFIKANTHQKRSAELTV